MNHPHEAYGKSMIEMLQSFNAAVQQAGGSIFSPERLRTMTAEDLFLTLAHNGVRFHYQKPIEIEQQKTSGGETGPVIRSFPSSRLPPAADLCL